MKKIIGLEVKFQIEIKWTGTSLEIQWLRLHASTAGGAGSIPGQGTKIPHAMWCDQKKQELN